MNSHSLAASPAFKASLAFCALVAMYAAFVMARWIFSKVIAVASGKRATPEEVETLELFEKFHRQTRVFARDLGDLERLSKKFPNLKESQLLGQMQSLREQLDLADSHLRLLFNDDDIDRGLPLVRFLCSMQIQPPKIGDLPSRLNLSQLVSWPDTALKLTQQMLDRIGDAARHHMSSGESDLPENFFELFDSLKKRVIRQENTRGKSS